MKVFTIENETNNITLHSSLPDADAVANAVSFRTEASLAKVAAEWPVARLIEIWNSLPGVKPVTKFTSRNVAIRRIWAAIQNLEEPAPAAAVADIAETTSDVAPAEGRATEGATAEKETKPAKEGAKSREGSKTETVLGLM
jgi:hypothetical protein